MQAPALTWLQPDQPMKTEFAPAAAVRVTVEPLVSFDVQPAVEPVVQVMPEPETVPVPAPSVVTVSGKVGSPKVAPTLVAALTEIAHDGVVPRHALPVQPLNTLPEPGVAVRVTAVPDT